ncbi:helix-turn-helix transcriptional regulator [Kiloniella sp. b19]|uniref:helix-turn-helix transcriptional regulator n=1 Tax=Kiloniella sp. GXU_MW_B19 TaxID=3141326 RepID=UPI0031E1BE23
MEHTGTGNTGMLDENGKIPYRQMIFTVFVVFVFGMSAVEIVIEFSAGETVAAMADDLARFAISALVLAVFVYEQYEQRKSIEMLRLQISKARGQLADLDADTKEIANQYRRVMQKQFDAWGLTASEQDIVIGILKGLSFREIAGLRETREKTVRQQASSVYRKAGVCGRNELTAWFFEDMLDPPHVNRD